MYSVEPKQNSKKKTKQNQKKKLQKQRFKKGIFLSGTTRLQ